MKLADLRKVSVKKRIRIRFALSNGMECVLNEHGVAQIPALKGVPSFNLEDELAGAQAFQVEPVSAGKDKPAPRRYTREEMTALSAAGAGVETGHDDHDE